MHVQYIVQMYIHASLCVEGGDGWKFWDSKRQYLLWGSSCFKHKAKQTYIQTVHNRGQQTNVYVLCLMYTSYSMYESREWICNEFSDTVTLVCVYYSQGSKIYFSLEDWQNNVKKVLKKFGDSHRVPGYLSSRTKLLPPPSTRFEWEIEMKCGSFTRRQNGLCSTVKSI
jgi:hypothetical protein